MSRPAYVVVSMVDRRGVRWELRDHTPGSWDGPPPQWESERGEVTENIDAGDYSPFVGVHYGKFQAS